MPSELRHVIFRLPEVVDAAVSHLQMAGARVPRGTVAESEILGGEGAGPVALRIGVRTDGPPGSATLDVAGDDLVAALVALCRRRCIPLPMRGTKAVERYGGRLALVIQSPDKAGAG